jgi:hypothetical protein
MQTLMFSAKLARWSLALNLIAWAAQSQCDAREKSSGMTEPVVKVRRADKIEFPDTVDCNSPSFWDGNQFYVFNSHAQATRHRGRDIYHLEESKDAVFDNKVNGGRWFEAVIKTAYGPVYGWYHFEPKGLCRGNSLTSAMIGAAKSNDNGLHWTDLGIVLKPADDAIRCNAKGGAVAGGHGDFCILFDREQKYLYVYFSNYSAPLAEQGVNVARMDWKDRDSPVGKVYKWHDGAYRELGLGGKMTPLLPGKVDYLEKDPESFWGPSIHWNTHLQRYVMLLNHGQGHNYRQEGIFVSFCDDPSKLDHWSAPTKILEGTSYEEHMTKGHSRSLSAKEKIYVRKWYPAVQGLPEMHGTDKLAGQKARLFLNAFSEYEIEFVRPEAADIK